MEDLSTTEKIKTLVTIIVIIVLISIIMGFVLLPLLKDFRVGAGITFVLCVFFTKSLIIKIISSIIEDILK